MSNNPEWRPRINIDVPEDLYYRMQRAFPWGVRNIVMVNILEQLVSAIEQEGEVVAYLIANKRLTIFGGGRDELEQSGVLSKP